jgi:hypothetical protein
MYRHFPYCWCLKLQLDVDNDEPVLRAALFKAKEAGFTNNVGFVCENSSRSDIDINGTMTYFFLQITIAYQNATYKSAKRLLHEVIGGGAIANLPKALPEGPAAEAILAKLRKAVDLLSGSTSFVFNSMTRPFTSHSSQGHHRNCSQS